jgi:hypothetical protein
MADLFDAHDRLYELSVATRRSCLVLAWFSEAQGFPGRAWPGIAKKEMDEDFNIESTDASWDNDELQDLVDYIDRQYSRRINAKFRFFADSVARQMRISRIVELIQYKDAASQRGDDKRINELLAEVLQGRRSVESAMRTIARDLNSARPTLPMLGSVEARPLLRSAIADFCHLCRRMHNPFGWEKEANEEYLVGELRAVFQRLEKLPMGTEMERADSDRLGDTLLVIHRKLPALRELFPLELRALTERRDRHRAGIKVPFEFITTDLGRSNVRQLPLIQCTAPRLCTVASSELVRAVDRVGRTTPVRMLIIDMTAVLTVDADAVPVLMEATGIAESRETKVLFAAGNMYNKLARLSSGMLALLETQRSCENVFSIYRDDCGRQFRAGDSDK